MKRVTIRDNDAGNDVGWDPNNIQTIFTIQEPNSVADSSSIIISVTSVHVCMVNLISDGSFQIQCGNALPENTELHYTIITLPPNIVS
jgi:hypothetical protein